MKRIRIAIDGAEVFLMLDGQRIAKRQHRRWVSLVAGVSAVDRDLGDDISEITVEIASGDAALSRAQRRDPPPGAAGIEAQPALSASNSMKTGVSAICAA